MALVALLLAPPRAMGICTTQELRTRTAVRCVQASLQALRRCRRQGTPLVRCDTDNGCEALPPGCRPNRHPANVLAAALGGPRTACTVRLARAGLRLAKRALAHVYRGQTGALEDDLARCVAAGSSLCEAAPVLGPPCADVTTPEDAAACVCGLAVPVFPATTQIVPGSCPSELADGTCASAVAQAGSCHEAFGTEAAGLCLTGHDNRAEIAATPPAVARSWSFPVRPRARVFNGLYDEVTGAVRALADGLGPAGAIVGASSAAHLRLTAPIGTSRLAVLRWFTGGLPPGAAARLHVVAGDRVLADANPVDASAEQQTRVALLSWHGDLDLTVSARVTAERDRAVPSSDLAWRLAFLDPTADDDGDGVVNARDPAPLDRTVPDPPTVSARPRVLLFGLDGGSWQVLDTLIDAGYVPTLAAIVRGGARAVLDETPNGNSCCYCPPIWSSIATGQPRTLHRMLNIEDEPFDRQAPALWTVLARYGGTATQVNYRNTFPAEPGVLYNLSEEGLWAAATQLFDAQQPYGFADQNDRLEVTWPPLLFETLGLLPAAGTGPQAWMPLAVDRVSVEALLRLAATSPADLTTWILHSVDKSEHLMWGSVQHAVDGPFDPDSLLQQAAHWTGPVEGPCCSIYTDFRWGNVASQYLEAEQSLAALLAVAHYDYIVLASDHSMTLTTSPVIPGGHVTPPAYTGIFAVTGPGILAGRDLGTVSLLDVAPTLAYLLDLPVAEDLPGQILTAAFSDAQLAEHPVRHVATWAVR